MERFSTKLKNRYISLDSNIDAVRFSFIVNKSISYLNLHTLEYSDAGNRFRTISEVADYFVCTEEKCRKIFAPSRSLLYKLNLDMPAEREFRLKNDIPGVHYSFDSSILHVAKISLVYDLDLWNISDVIEAALKVPGQKLKILGLLVKSPVLKKEFLPWMPTEIMNNFIDCFYPKIADSVLFNGFIKAFDLVEWACLYENAAILEYFLYHVRRNARNTDMERYGVYQLIDDCILKKHFLNIKPILKYKDAPEYSLGGYEEYQEEISTIRPNLTFEVLDEIEKLLTPQRLYWMLQCLWIYIESERPGRIEDAKEALRLLWNSSPVVCITLGEIKSAFRGFLADEELTRMHEFYCKSIGEYHSVAEPRSLKHLCRTVIRSILTKNAWISEGIESLKGLPESLKLFLNLELVII